MRIVLLFDIDYTLFDTDKFRDFTYPSLRDLLDQEDTPTYHNTIKIIEKQLISEGGYEPVAFAKILSKALQLEPKREEIERIFYDQNVYGSCLYPEVKDVLNVFSQKEKIVLGIISKGVKSFQERKIDSIKQYFNQNDISISLNKFDVIPTILEKYKNDRVYIIDDSAPFLDAIKKIDKNITTILVEEESRYEKRKIPVGFSPDYSIHSLSEMIGLVDNKR